MKRILVVVLALAFIGGIAFGDPTNQVLSKNAVGYVKVTIPRGALMMIQTPFENLSGAVDFSVGELLGSNIPGGSVAYFWSKADQQYKSENFGTRWIPGTNRFERGEGLFVRIAANAVSDYYDIFLMGEVPDSITAPTSEMQFVKGLQMIGYMYPTEIPITNSMLTSVAKGGDALYYWKTNQQWGSENFGTRWIPGTLKLQPGQAYFYKTTNTSLWSESKPYSWP